jgi:hypothetical protein
MRHCVQNGNNHSDAWHFGCNPHLQRYLVTRTARLRWVVVLPLLALCAMFTPQLVTSSRSPVLAATATTPASDQVDLPADPSDTPNGGDDGMADLYGNEVTSAVAKYTYDATGSLFELHSPQTELPRLGSPKS